VAITEKEVAEFYVKTLTNLGMEIAFAKSIVPNGRGNSAEIAKRIFLDSVEKSPINPQLISISTNSLQDLLALDRILSERDYYRTSILNDGNSKNDNETVNPGFLSRSSVIQTFLSKVKLEERATAYIFMSSSLSNIQIDASCAHNRGGTLLSEVYDLVWTKDFSFKNSFERFLLEVLTERIVKFETALAGRKKITSSELSSSEELNTTPIIETYYNISIDSLRCVLNKYNTSYVDEEGDSDELLDATDPNFIMKEIFATPDPLDNSAYFKRQSLSMDKLRSDLLTQYLIKREGAENFKLLLQKVKNLVN
jgi:hypothetical protein